MTGTPTPFPGSDAELIHGIEAIARRLSALAAGPEAATLTGRRLEDIRADLTRLAEETKAIATRLDTSRNDV